MGNKACSKETEKRRDIHKRKRKGPKLDRKMKRRGGEAGAKRRTHSVRSKLLSSKFLPRVNEQIQMPDLENVLQLLGCPPLSSDSILLSPLAGVATVDICSFLSCCLTT